MTKTASELMMEAAKRQMPNTLDDLIRKYVNTIQPAEDRFVAATELRKFAGWFRAEHSASRTNGEPA